MSFRCVVFDIDDTLYLERDYVRSGFRAVDQALEGRGVSGFYDAAWSAFRTGRRGTIFDAALADLGIEGDPQLITDLVEVYRSHPPDIHMLDDAEECLRRLAGSVIGVVTDGPLASQRAKAAALRADEWAQVIVLTGELGEGFGKPHCRAFEIIEERTGFGGADCVYLADNPAKDFVAPRQLGWATVRVRRPESLHFDVASGDDVDDEVADLTDFPPGRR